VCVSCGARVRECRARVSDPRTARALKRTARSRPALPAAHHRSLRAEPMSTAGDGMVDASNGRHCRWVVGLFSAELSPHAADVGSAPCASFVCTGARECGRAARYESEGGGFVDDFLTPDALDELYAYCTSRGRR
jgi:hypothetical protein